MGKKEAVELIKGYCDLKWVLGGQGKRGMARKQLKGEKGPWGRKLR